jgi:hypothetical protein
MYVPAGTQTESRQATTEPTMAQFGFAQYDIPVKSIYNTDDDTGKERTYFVTDDATWQGYVFEDQIGRNFDGEIIVSYVRTVFNQVNTPTYRKKFRRADLEVNTVNQLALTVLSELDYSASNTPSQSFDIDDILGGGGFYGTDDWDTFYWDGQSVASGRIELGGSGENISFQIYNESAKVEPFTLQSLIVHYDMRRIQR